MIPGADVNEYHPINDWAAYIASGRSYLAFKATGGAKGWNYTDPTLDEHLNGSRAHGLAGIAYHFLRSDHSAVEQADHFLTKVPHKGIVLVCDFEAHAPTNSHPTLAQLNAFVDRVDTVTGRASWVYTTRGVWNSLTGGAKGPSNNPLWHAEWRDQIGAMYGGWTKPVLWQITSTASVPGVSGLCDDNRLLIEPIELLRQAWGSTNVSAQDRGWGPPCPDAQIVNIKPVATRSFNVHKRVAKIFYTFIRELEDRGYDIEAGQLDDWSYACRKIAGSTSWSNHAWGLAVDINSLRNPMGSTLVTDMPAWVRDANYLMRKYGLRWGGTYVNRPDAMHFEFMLTPADADRLTAALGEDDDMFEPTDRETLKAIKTEIDQLRSDMTVTGTTGLEQTFELLYSRAKGADMDADKILALLQTSLTADAIANAVVAKLPPGAQLTAADVAREIIKQLSAAPPPPVA